MRAWMINLSFFTRLDDLKGETKIWRCGVGVLRNVYGVITFFGSFYDGVRAFSGLI